jgi:hypothetical protein
MTTETEAAIADIENQQEADARPNSVVKGKYKAQYAERAKTARGKKGVDRRVTADSCGDWLALELAALIRPKKSNRTDLDFFRAILDANGVDYSKLPVGTKNWQGRFRMNGGQMLRTAVAEADGELIVPEFDGAYVQTEEHVLNAPRVWVARNTTA